MPLIIVTLHLYILSIHKTLRLCNRIMKISFFIGVGVTILCDTYSRPSNSADFFLDIMNKYAKIGCKFHNLIESGGGTGPMKPDNLRNFARCQFRR